MVEVMHQPDSLKLGMQWHRLAGQKCIGAGAGKESETAGAGNLG